MPAQIELKHFDEKIDTGYLNKELKNLKTNLELTQLNREVLRKKLTPAKCADLLEKVKDIDRNKKENLPKDSFGYVLALQMALHYIGYGQETGSIDCWFGDNTRKGVKAFQIDYNKNHSTEKIKEDSIPGKETTPLIIKSLRSLSNITPESSEISSQSSEIPSQSSEIPSQSSEIPSQSSEIPSQSSEISSQSSEISSQSSEISSQSEVSKSSLIITQEDLQNYETSTNYKETLPILEPKWKGKNIKININGQNIEGKIVEANGTLRIEEDNGTTYSFNMAQITPDAITVYVGPDQKADILNDEKLISQIILPTEIPFENLASNKKIEEKIINLPEATVTAKKLPKTEIEKIMETKSVTEIIKSASEIIKNKNFDEWLQNGYVMGCLYYSDSFYKATKDKQKDETQSIAHSLRSQIDLPTKNAFFNYLITKSKTSESVIQTLPLDNINVGTNLNQNHPDALDIFEKEGTAIKSICNGIVILADKNRDPKNKTSTSSYKGGNAVIIFEPTTKKCYRYAHLDQVKVNAGDIIQSGTEIGTIGHTGKNAMVAGHGNHIHLEINYIGPDKTEFTSATDIKKLLDKIQTQILLTKK